MNLDFIQLTAIAAAACYAARLTIEAGGFRSDLWQRRARVCWSLGAVLLLLHVFAAFHWQHAWSYAAAWEHTRRRTQTLTGWNSGSGLWANFAVTGMWLVDAVGWLKDIDWPARHPYWFWFLQLSLAFMMLNATAVFGPQYWTPIVAGCLFLWGVMHFRSRRSAR